MSEHLTKGQKTEVENIILKTLLAGGLITSLIAGGVGFFSGKVAAETAAKDKEGEISSVISSAATATENADAATKAALLAAGDIDVLERKLNYDFSVEGWPIAIRCYDSRQNRESKIYHLIATDWVSEQVSNKQVVVYRHMWADRERKNRHDVQFDAKTKLVVFSRTGGGGRLVNCRKDDHISDVVKKGGMFTSLSLNFGELK